MNTSIYRGLCRVETCINRFNKTTSSKTIQDTTLSNINAHAQGRVALGATY